LLFLADFKVVLIPKESGVCKLFKTHIKIKPFVLSA